MRAFPVLAGGANHPLRGKQLRTTIDLWVNRRKGGNRNSKTARWFWNFIYDFVLCVKSHISRCRRQHFTFAPKVQKFHSPQTAAPYRLLPKVHINQPLGQTTTRFTEGYFCQSENRPLIGRPLIGSPDWLITIGGFFSSVNLFLNHATIAWFSVTKRQNGYFRSAFIYVNLFFISFVSSLYVPFKILNLLRLDGRFVSVCIKNGNLF